MVCQSLQKCILIIFHIVFLRECIQVLGQFPANRDRVRLNPSNRVGFSPVKLHPCEKSSCYPATGNLLIGREDQLYASSTCGLHEPQRYCIVSHLEERKKCFICDSTPTTKPNPMFNHNISNIVYRMYPGEKCVPGDDSCTRQKSWWQSENGKENVYIQLDLEAEFHFTHLIITFKTFRPAAMLIERSYDFKKSWHVYRYFAYNCAESFPHVREGHPRNLSDVVCESRYSDVAPSSGGEVIYRVLSSTMPIDNPYSEQVQNLLKITNLRINFTKLHTLGDDLLDKREEIQEKYYYAITDMVVRGSCSCYGHANRCLPLPGIDPKPDMVHGRCECTHNTKGRNCEKCEDFFNDLPWRPAIGKQTNACQKCNCNNHAVSCHFDRAVYEASGRISGGVCDGCLHNTIGQNCGECKPFYYKDPSRDIQDPEVCRPCDCDPRGSLNDGICDSVTDPVNDLVAGTCHCKENVESPRCDTCKNGFWNFTAENPKGCQACSCNLHGTVDNQGCDVNTGECYCKRNVIGRNCDQCLPEFWGLSEIQVGCQPCDCDPGGAYDNFCDVINGQCRCRDHMTGRRCDTPKQRYFTANLDFLLYEAELTRSTGSNSQVIIREPHVDGTTTTWTGLGYLKVFEGATIEFIIDNLTTSMNYDIVIRYEPITPEGWEDVRVIVERPRPVDPNGPCANHFPEADKKQTSLPATSRSVTVFPPACLEANQTYIIQLDFRRYSYQRENPSAAVLIDSIVLIPRVDQLPLFHGSAPAEARRQEFERNRCDDPAYFVRGAPVPEICKHFYTSIGSYIFNGAFSCDCDPEGALSNYCDPHGGFCTCRQNVVGRRCDRCAPGTYGFGPNGCQACDCNSIGALDNFCDMTTGQCKCRPNTYGTQCDKCQTGFWNFPNCQRCECNGHAEKCDSRTGACIDCTDNTVGHNCERCNDSYYGDPRLNVNIPCRPCPCPGIKDSGHNQSHADKCTLDPFTKDVICECHLGYAGARCDVCADNYYGNPEEENGFCQPCDCNDKIDLLRPGNCDPHTGKCKQCLYDTTGDHCEVCRPNYFRYSKEHMCEECVCHPLGTNATAGPCDPHSGQCPCLPNVDGLKCDQCITNHWKIASGTGCEPCDCDPLGSVSAQCNEFDGQCICNQGFGGRRCNECMAQFYGDPKIECKPCQCDLRGSQTLQCDRQSGACICLPGIGGYNCDKCARGYIGVAPNCAPCGECFDNWDRILQESKNATLDLIKKAKEIKVRGTSGAYTKEFDEMQSQLDEIMHLLDSTADVDVDELKRGLEDLRQKLNETQNEMLTTLDESLVDTEREILYTDVTLKNLKKSIEEAINKTQELKNNGTQLQEANVQGALLLIQEAKEKADQAVMKADHTKVTINYAERQCAATENFLNTSQESFKNQLAKNDQELQNIRDKLQKLENAIPDLNDLVCDGRGDPCNSICGGVGCGHCGNSISCKDGAKQLAETALAVANSTENAIKEKETTANDIIRAVSQINTNETRNVAYQTYEKAKQALDKSNVTLTEYNNLLFEMLEFSTQNNTKPEDIKRLANEVLAKKINTDDAEIQELAQKIKKTVNTLTNTEPIIEATREDLKKVNKLKNDAESLKNNATDLLTNAEFVNKALESANTAQKEAESAINKALNDVDKVNDLLYQIGNETENAQVKTTETEEHIKRLRDQVSQLQRNITDNGIYANRVVNESASTMKNAQNTYTEFNNLKDKYKKAKEDLGTNIQKVKFSKERVDTLLKRAVHLVSQVSHTEQEITKLANSSQEETLDDLKDTLQDLISQMNRYTRVIEDRLDNYRTCNN